MASAATAYTVDELTINKSGTATNGFVFKQENLDTLYGKILNNASGKGMLSEISGKISGTATYGGAGTVNKMINSDAINGGAMLKVKFGDLEWQVVSVTRSNGGDVIATLWLTSNNTGTGILSSFSDPDHKYMTNLSVTYSTLIYATSYVRVVTLNGGGQYVVPSSNTNASLSSPQSGQNHNTVFANFTVESKTGSLTNYIVKPKDVKYQEQESWVGSASATAYRHNCASDAYGTPYTGDFDSYVQPSLNKHNYNAWQNDYLWLPSLAEVGGGDADTARNTATGIWNMPDATFRARNNGWVRSTGSSINIYYINSGKFKNSGTISYKTINTYPCLHLNLTKAQEDAVAIIDQPSDGAALVYNGVEQTYTPVGFDDTTMEISGNKATTVNDYTCTVTPKAGYAWSDYSTTAVTMNYKVEQAEPNVTFAFADSALESYTKFYLKDFSSLPAITNSHANATAGSIAWDSGQTPSKTKSEYTWTFTPEDTVNYKSATGTKTMTFADAVAKKANVYVKDGATIYDRYDTVTYASLSDYLKSCLTVKIEYEDGSEGSPLADSSYNVTTTNISVTAGDSQSKTISVRVTSTDDTNGFTGSVSATVNKAVIQSISVEGKDGAQNLSYPFTLDDVKGNYDVYLGWNFSARELKADASKVTVALDGGGELTAGTLPFTFTYTDGDLLKTSDSVEVVIAKGTYDVSGITFVGDTLNYDNGAHSLSYSGTLPAGVGVEYGYNGTKQSTPWEFTDANSYEITLSFTQEDGNNYELITETKTVTLTIEKAKLTITAKDKEITYGDTAANDGVTYSGFVSGEDESVLSGELVYSYGEYTSGKGAGEYEIEISGLEAANYEIKYVAGKLTVVPKEITLTISDSGHKHGEEFVTEYSFVQPAEGVLVGEDTLAVINGVTFTVKDGTGATIELNSQTAVGEYSITATDGVYGNYKITFISGKYEVTAADDNAELENKKAAAKAELEKTAQAKRDEIDASDLTDEEKAEKKAQVEAELEKGNAAIESATDVSEVDKAFGDAKKSIEGIRFGFGGGFDIMSMWWIFVIVGAVLLIIILVVVIVVVKKRKAATAGYDDYYDDDYDYDDGDGDNEDYDYDGEEYDDGDEDIIIEDDE